MEYTVLIRTILVSLVGFGIVSVADAADLYLLQAGTCHTGTFVESSYGRQLSTISRPVKCTSKVQLFGQPLSVLAIEKKGSSCEYLLASFFDIPVQALEQRAKRIVLVAPCSKTTKVA